MKKIIIILLIMSIFSIYGCGPKLTSSEIAALDYGPYPSQEYPHLVIGLFSHDEDVVNYTFVEGQLVKKFRQGLFGATWGWSGIVYVKKKEYEYKYVGKNSYKVFKGYSNEPYRFYIRNEEVVGWHHL